MKFYLFGQSYLHIGIQMGTVIFGLTGFIIIVVYTKKVDGNQFGMPRICVRVCACVLVCVSLCACAYELV